MPKNIVIIDEDKADMPAPDELISSANAASYERVLPSSNIVLQATERPPSKKPNILRGGNRVNVVHTPVTSVSKPGGRGGTAVTTGAPRIVTVSAAPDGNQTSQSHTAVISNTTGPRLGSHRGQPHFYFKSCLTLAGLISVPVLFDLSIVGRCGWLCRCR